MISESTPLFMQIHDSPSSRLEQDLHGWAHGNRLPPAGCWNRTTHWQSRWLQTQVFSYPCRFKEIEKRDLDRHSYEIQIKELTERAFDGDRYKKDSDKLREFIQKQTIELEEYKKRVSEIDSNVQAKYHKALKQIESMHKDNSDIKNDLNQAIQEINTWKAKFEALERSKNR